MNGTTEIRRTKLFSKIVAFLRSASGTVYLAFRPDPCEAKHRRMPRQCEENFAVYGEKV